MAKPKKQNTAKTYPVQPVLPAHVGPGANLRPKWEKSPLVPRAPLQLAPVPQPFATFGVQRGKAPLARGKDPFAKPPTAFEARRPYALDPAKQLGQPPLSHLEPWWSFYQSREHETFKG